MGAKHNAAVRAVIDIGTNSVKLLVAEVCEGRVHPLYESSNQTRLGKGFYESHQLQPEAIRETAMAVAEFAGRARQYTDLPPRVVATSAARDALNASALIDAIREASSLEVEIISGEQEAEWVFQGVSRDSKLGATPLLIVDVGGGSTEMIVGEGAHYSVQQSFPMGSVRLMEKLRPADPPTMSDLAGCRGWLKEFFDREIAPSVESFLQTKHGQRPVLVGTGGTSSLLARMEKGQRVFRRDQIEGTRLSREKVLGWMVHLWSLSLAERREIVGLPANRADIILMGVAIYEAVMEHFKLDLLYVSTRGLRFGVVAA